MVVSTAKELIADLVSRQKQAGDWMSIHSVHECENITGEVIVRSFFGRNLSHLKLEGRPIGVELAQLVADCMHYTRISGYVRFKFIFLGVRLANMLTLTAQERKLKLRVDNLLNIIKGIVVERIEEAKKNGLKGDHEEKDFIDFFMKAYFESLKTDNPMEIDEIVQQFVTF